MPLDLTEISEKGTSYFNRCSANTLPKTGVLWGYFYVLTVQDCCVLGLEPGNLSDEFTEDRLKLTLSPCPCPSPNPGTCLLSSPRTT